jgi:multiple sugar transport system substrate-binding protein
MANRVILEKQPVKESLDQAAKAEQDVLDAAK